MDADDLLQAYALTGNDSTFTQFVESCSGMVYGIAQRQLGDPSAAEEVAQNVFLLVAKKSRSLAARRGILAWLQRSTILEVKNRKRHEASRRRQLERFSKHKEAHSQPDGSDGPDHLASLADLALSRLSSQDRQVVLLRYYEDRSYGEISEIMGKGEPALRKQLSRTLKRMEKWCRDGCPKVSGAALVAALSMMANDRAPAAIAPSVSASVGAEATLGLGGGLPSISVISTLALVCLIAVPLLVLQQRRLGEVQPVMARETSARPGSLLAVAETDRDLRELRPLSADEAVKDPARFAKALLHTHGLSMTVRGETEDDPLMAHYPHDLSGILLAQASLLDGEQLRLLINEVTQLRGLARSKNEIAGSLIEILGRKDPESALTLAHRDRRGEDLKQVLYEWCERDVDSAVVWIADLKASASWLPLELEIQIYSGLCQALVAMDADQSVSLALPYLAKDTTGEFLRQLTRQLAYHREHGAFLSLTKGLSSPEDKLVELLVDYVEDAFGRTSVELTSQSSLEGARALFNHPSFPQEFRDQALIAAAVEPNMDVLAFTFPAVIELSSSDKVKPNLLIVIRHLVMGRRLLEAELWYDHEILSPYRDDLLAEAAKGIFRKDSDIAAAWMDLIDNDELRSELSNSLQP